MSELQDAINSGELSQVRAMLNGKISDKIGRLTLKAEEKFGPEAGLKTKSLLDAGDLRGALYSATRELTGIESALRRKLNQPMMNPIAADKYADRFNPTLMQGKNLVAEVMPVIGDAKALEDAKKSYEAGSVGGALFNAATAVPGIGELAMGGKAILPLMTAFHGSPYKFSKVSNEAIGTGEGAQAYGYGHYYGESRGTGEWYQKNLSARAGYAPENIRAAVDRRHAAKANYDDLNRRLIEDPNSVSKVDAAPIVAEYDAAQKEYEKIVVPYSEGFLYEVDIPDEKIDAMLDWDAPLSEQPEKAKNAIKKLWNKIYDEPFDAGMTGARFYDDLTEAELSQEGASAALRREGIPGIKYFDGSSRKAGEGTRNFVVFDEADVKILKRNDKPIED